MKKNLSVRTFTISKFGAQNLIFFNLIYSYFSIINLRDSKKLASDCTRYTTVADRSPVPTENAKIVMRTTTLAQSCDN